MGTIKTGNIIEADDLINNLLGLSFKNYAQAIFNADYIGWNSKLSGRDGEPIFSNLDYDTFQIDTADTKTNITYNANNDCYQGNDGENTGTLITDVYSSDDTITNAILVANYKNYKSYQDEITNPGFESAIGAEWTYSETDGNWSGARISSETPKVGSYQYKFTKVNDGGSLGYAQITQTVDLTNATNIGVWVRNYAPGSNWTYMKTSIYLDSTEIDNSQNGNSQEWIGGEIPVEKRTSGVEVKLRVTQSNYQSGEFYAWFDAINIWNETEEDTTTCYLSADNGSNYEEITPNEIHRFSNTGTQLKTKIVISQTNGTFGGQEWDTGAISRISEYAVLYNIGAGSS